MRTVVATKSSPKFKWCFAAVRLRVSIKMGTISGIQFLLVGNTRYLKLPTHPLIWVGVPATRFSAGTGVQTSTPVDKPTHTGLIVGPALGFRDGDPFRRGNCVGRTHGTLIYGTRSPSVTRDRVGSRQGRSNSVISETIAGTHKKKYVSLTYISNHSVLDLHVITPSFINHNCNLETSQGPVAPRSGRQLRALFCVNPT